MSSRLILLIVILGIAVGLVFGLTVGVLTLKPAVTVETDAVKLGPPEQDDYVIMVAEAYAGDQQLALARDRLARLQDQAVDVRVEKLAISYAPQHDLISTHLALLSVALGSRNPTLVALSATATPTSTPTFTPTFTNTPTHTPSMTPTFLPTPTSLFTDTPTRTRTTTRVPPTRTFTPSPTRLPPPVVFEPDPSRWPGSVHFYPAQVKAGEGYWHLAKVVYCDAFDKSDPRNHDFGCDEMAGGSAGTSIYVMTGGATVDIIRPDGANIEGSSALGTEKKSPSDICNCTYSFESSAYRISVRGAPSDAIDGFCLCSVNFGWGSRAHVRYFLYFEYITR